VGVRVKVKIEANDRSIITSALVNSGFESTSPDIIVPMGLAEKLGLWPPTEVESEEALTAGGQVTLYLVKRNARISIICGNEVRKVIKGNLIVNPHVDEVLLSDYVIDELGIVVISFRRGLWRHETDELEKVRESTKPQYW